MLHVPRSPGDACLSVSFEYLSLLLGGISLLLLQVGAHLACSSFLRADCPRALVSGVNLTIRAETTAVLSKAGMLTQVCQ